MPGHLSYGKAILIAFDQLLNTVFSGWPDETLSSRAWRWDVAQVRSWPRKIIDGLFFWDKNHCRESYESERLRRQFPVELR